MCTTYLCLIYCKVLIYVHISVAFLYLGNKAGLSYSRDVCVHDISVAFLYLGNKAGLSYSRHVCVHEIYVDIYICGYIVRS